MVKVIVVFFLFPPRLTSDYFHYLLILVKNLFETVKELQDFDFTVETKLASFR